MMSGLKSDQACLMSVNEVEEQLQTHLDVGLSSNEVLERRKNHGHNEFTEEEETTLVIRYLEQFKEPMILLLLGSAVISVCMGQVDDALSITVAIIIVVTVAFIQEYRSEQSLQALKKLVPPKCHCMRDGRLETFLARDLVPGDIVHISVGDRVPADIRLFETVGLTVDESSFTGEPKPARKAISICSSNAHIVDRHNIGYMGTLVRCGSAKGVVIGTGENSEFGEIFKMMQAEEAPKTPLQKNMDSLGKQLSFYSFCIIGLIIIIGWIQGHPLVDIFTIGVSLAVAAIPEGLPIVVTVTLALGVMRMANKRTIVKKLPAVETLGCVNIICCDKTGTLTKNQMSVVRLIGSDGTDVEKRESDVTVNGSPFNINEVHDPSINKMLEVAATCNNAQLIEGELHGTATEGALLTCAVQMGYKAGSRYIRMFEWPFSSESKLMKVRCKDTHDNSTKYFVKGAVERVLDMCDRYHGGGTAHAMSDKIEQRFLTQAVELGQMGLRVLALACGSIEDRFTYVGMIGIVDPPRPGVKESILMLNACGVRLKMITGDGKETAVAIAKDLNIYKQGDKVLSGNDIECMEQNQFESIVNQVTVFYRTSPKHKTYIIKALRNTGQVVSMTGDGVNDAIALKSADIGIAMGKGGTDVCKEAADVILVEDDFTAMLDAIEEGRGIFYNIRNFVRFQLSTSVAALTLIAMSVFFRLPNPLNAMQILWINILMDGPPAQSLGVEPVDANVRKQPPRRVKDHIINKQLLINVFISAFVIVAGTLFIFRYEMSDNQITPRDTTMTFTCFVLFDMFNAMTCRSQTRTIMEVGLFTNKVLVMAVGGSLIGQLLVIYFPPLQAVFQTEALYFSDIVLLVSISSSVMIVSEVKKVLDKKWGKTGHIYVDNNNLV